MIYGCAGITAYIEELIVASPQGVDTAYTVAEQDRRIVGCVEMRLLSNALFLNCISISPEVRSHGIGRALLSASLKRAHRHRLELHLDVIERNTAAREWYRRLGFEELGVTHWWSLPLPVETPPAFYSLSGYPQAEICQKAFGFSQFTLSTETGSYAVGRIAERWFRTTQSRLLNDSSARAGLAQIDARRRLLALLNEGDLPERSRAEAELLMSTRRLSVSLAELRGRLGQE
jgi:predicted GNAT family acetyltransferase